MSYSILSVKKLVEMCEERSIDIIEMRQYLCEKLYENDTLRADEKIVKK